MTLALHWWTKNTATHCTNIHMLHCCTGWWLFCFFVVADTAMWHSYKRASLPWSIFWFKHKCHVNATLIDFWVLALCQIVFAAWCHLFISPSLQELDATITQTYCCFCFCLITGCWQQTLMQNSHCLWLCCNNSRHHNNLFQSQCITVIVTPLCLVLFLPTFGCCILKQFLFSQHHCCIATTCYKAKVVSPWQCCCHCFASLRCLVLLIVLPVHYCH